ncbi:Sua5/YciO/YrdC/YwlC family protein [Seminibacterium arietis]|uniref:Threonylcarbamoyl-AMP synthase n=1 Tax=Seminibacterium arietis TaxID=1173502 RepID=A0ABW3IBC2_9PAST
MNIDQIIKKLNDNQVIAYPTEAVFGLGCNPLSQSAVEKLLILKNRPVEKGLILVAPTLNYLHSFIDSSQFQSIHWERLTTKHARPITWIVPASSFTPSFITGQFSTVAIRLCSHEAVKLLCEKTGFAITSTSANLSGLPPCKSVQEVKAQFGECFPVLEMNIGEASNPSEIRDLFTGKIFRQG